MPCSSGNEKISYMTDSHEKIPSIVLVNERYIKQFKHKGDYWITCFYELNSREVTIYYIFNNISITYTFLTTRSFIKSR